MMLEKTRRAAVLALLVVCSLSAHAIGDLAKRIDIPAGDLSRALLLISKQYGADLVYRPEQVHGLKTQGVHGELTIEEAISRALAGTRLQLRTDSSGALLITSSLADTLSDKGETVGRGTGSQQQIASGVADGIRLAEVDQGTTPASLGEIIVTAQKRSERLQDVSSSVSVLSARQMLESHQTQLQDYAATIPGLNVDTGGSAGQSTLSIRGLTTSGGGGATVATYIDDVPLGSSGGWQRALGHALELLPYDLERIEVLRGPQGTFYGANAFGGLLKYVTKSPDLYGSELSVGTDLLRIHGGSDTGYTARVGGSAPLIDGKLAVRASYARDFAPGYIDLPELDRQDVNRSTRQAGNLALLWQPTEALSLKITGLMQRIDSADGALVRLDLTTNQPTLGDLTGVSVVARPFKQTLQMYSLTLKDNFDWVELTAASSYESSKIDERLDVTPIYGPLVTFLTGGTVAASREPLDDGLDFRKYTQELRLATPIGPRFEGMLGGFFTYEDAPGNIQVLSALNAAGAPISGLSPLVVASIPTTYREEAIFTNVTYHATERFDVATGVRYSQNQQGFRSIVSGPLLPPSDTPNHSSESAFNYSVAPRFRFNKDVMAYLRVATGYRPGGPNVPSVDPHIPVKYNADRITNYEVGVKSSLADHLVELNVAAFQVNWRDVQITLLDPSTGASFGANGRTARSRGIEWESIYHSTDRLKLGLTATFIDAVLTADLPANSATVGLAGDRLPSAPRFRAAASADYSFSIGDGWAGRLGGIYQYVGSRYSGLSRDPITVSLNSYSMTDLNIGAANRAWSINLFIRNLADKRAYGSEAKNVNALTGRPASIDAAVIQPRTVGVSVDRRF